MSNVLVSPSDLVVRAGPVRSLAAAAVALALAAGGAARVRLQGQASAPMFGDATVRKGAGGR
jgi:hypothetical protein